MEEALAGDNQGGAHLGMASICMRLRLIYGEDARMQADTGVAGQTTITLDIPQRGTEA